MGAVVLPQPNFLQSLLTAQQAVGGLQEIQQRAQQQRQLEALRQRLQSQQNLPTVLAQLATVSPQAAAQAREGLNLPFQQQGIQQKALLDAARAQGEILSQQQPLSVSAKSFFDQGLRGGDLARAVAEQRAKDDAFRREELELRKLQARKPGVVVNTGDVPKPSESAISQLQKERIARSDVLSSIKEIASVAPELRERLSLGGRVLDTLAVGSDFLYDDLFGSGSRVDARQEFESKVELLFANLAKQISGSAIAEAELARLRRTFPNIGQSPRAFAAAMKSLTDMLLASERNAIILEASGIRFGSEEYKTGTDIIFSGSRGTSEADQARALDFLTKEQLRGAGENPTAAQTEQARDRALLRMYELGFFPEVSQ